MTNIVFRVPLITGETTVNEGDTLHLMCDSTNSRPLPTVQWFSPDGEILSVTSILHISNINRSLAGNFTCTAYQHISNTAMSSSLNIIIQCMCFFVLHYLAIVSKISSKQLFCFPLSYQLQSFQTSLFNS